MRQRVEIDLFPLGELAGHGIHELLVCRCPAEHIAIERDELFLHYQPQLAAGGRVRVSVG